MTSPATLLNFGRGAPFDDVDDTFPVDETSEESSDEADEDSGVEEDVVGGEEDEGVDDEDYAEQRTGDINAQVAIEGNFE